MPTWIYWFECTIMLQFCKLYDRTQHACLVMEIAKKGFMNIINEAFKKIINGSN